MSFIVKVSDHLRIMHTGVDLSTNRFLSVIIDAVAKKVKEDAGVDISPSGKSVSGDTISLSLIGFATKDEIEKVDEVIAGIKNPSAFVNLLR